jgi:hypothetical protein
MGSAKKIGVIISPRAQAWITSRNGWRRARVPDHEDMPVICPTGQIFCRCRVADEAKSKNRQPVGLDLV